MMILLLYVTIQKQFLKKIHYGMGIQLKGHYRLGVKVTWN